MTDPCSQPAPSGKARQELENRLWEKVIRGSEGECWLWKSGRSRTRGYGQIAVGGRMWLAHRVVWWLAHGPISEDMHVLHSCNNKSCCNPAHFFLGTHADNMEDMVRKGRSPDTTGEHNPSSKLTEELIRAIRRAYDTGEISQRKLARQYGISQVCISGIVRRKRWSHIRDD